MKRLLISGFVSIALLAVATTWRSQSISNDNHAAVTTGMASLKKSQATASANKLPIEEIEDLSLIFSPPTKH
jgi:hypothetical protein